MYSIQQMLHTVNAQYLSLYCGKNSERIWFVSVSYLLKQGAAEKLQFHKMLKMCHVSDPTGAWGKIHFQHQVLKWIMKRSFDFQR